jgi:hypothetical protein
MNADVDAPMRKESKMSYCPDCKQDIRLGGPPHTCTERREREAKERLAHTTCSQLDVMQAVFEAITKEMAAMERIEAKAAEDRHWSMADAMKNKRLAYDSALGFAMRGIERAFSSANAQGEAQPPAKKL